MNHRWVVYSIEKKMYRSENGFEQCPSRARFFTEGEAAEVVADSDEVLVARVLDASLGTADLLLVAGATIEKHYVHPRLVHQIATAEMKRFSGEAPVVIDTVVSEPQVLDLNVVASSALRKFQTATRQRRIETRYDQALRNFDRALSEFKRRKLSLLLREV